MANHYRFIIGEENENERVDKVLATLLTDCSRSYLQKLVKQELVLVNNETVKPSTLLKTEDELVIDVPELKMPEIMPEDISIDIIYEDADLLICNKAKGMVVHPAPGHYSGTLVNAIMFHCHDLSGINGMLRPGIVHRIDKDTTGLLIICKNDFCHNAIAEQLKVHSVERTYHAIVEGNIKETKGTINKPIGRHSMDRKKMAINEIHGKNAVTHFEVLERFGNYTYIKCNLETGRTHQIRVHMADMGHPLLGDFLYGAKSTKFQTTGQTLHAKTIGFIHPSTKKWVSFNSELPEYFKKILIVLSQKK